MKKILTTLTSLSILCSATHAQEREGRRDRPATQQNVDWDQIKKRIEGAVKRGDLTRDQANAKYSEIKKQLAARTQSQKERQHDGHHDRDAPSKEARMKMLLGRLVEGKKISREVAGQIYNLAFEGGEEHREHGEHHDEGKKHEHLEELAEELEKLIHRARHELEQIEEARKHLGVNQDGHWKHVESDHVEPQNREEGARKKNEKLKKEKKEDKEKKDKS